ncbi:MAG: hypothetical protein IPL03_01010 [Sterolibacteriaceae bacterium]|nr:hypothetical protein [Candidatus Methylophosphatis haderslevensis]
MNRFYETPHQLLMRGLKIDPSSAAALATAGMTTIEEIAYVPIEEMRTIVGLDQESIEDWRNSARRYLLRETNGGNDDDPQSEATTNPVKPPTGGSGATRVRGAG